MLDVSFAGLKPGLAKENFSLQLRKFGVIASSDIEAGDMPNGWAVSWHSTNEKVEVAVGVPMKEVGEYIEKIDFRNPKYGLHPANTIQPEFKRR